MMTFLRSTFFNILFYGGTAILCFLYIWLLLFPHRLFVRMIILLYLRPIYWLERHILGLDYEIRGIRNIPHDRPFIVAAKHQSAYETLKLHLILNDPAVILKRELLWIPIWGWYAARLRLIPIRRGARGAAVRSMIDGAKRVFADGRPLVIFPQGTRVAVDANKPYKVGIGKLYQATDIPVIPLALNSGHFWGRNSYIKKSGTVVFEFLPAMDAGLPLDVFMADLEKKLEKKSQNLLSEAQTNPRI